MVRHYGTNPLDNDPDEKLTFDDVTTLVFVATITIGLGFLLVLGILCATHRLEALL